MLLILVIALGVLINAGWRTLHQTEPLKTHLALTDALQGYSAELDKRVMEYSPRQLTQLQQALANTLQASSKIISNEARASLRLALKTLQEGQASTHANLSLIQKKIRIALHTESNIQTRLLHQLARSNRLELETATFIAITLPLLGLLMLFFLRHRILRPLNDLNLLINRLGQQTPPPLSVESVDPLLKPLFVDVNTMLRRLSDLELAQQQHQQELEQKVRYATQTLLEYHDTLVQSERLATIGELTAKLAHELRNPLAGIHLALANLAAEIKDEDKITRLMLVLKELERMTQLSNRVLDGSRYRPEPASRFQLVEMLDSLLQLVQYQIPVQITIEPRVPTQLLCHMPEGRLRQALLNLILNAAQSIGTSPGKIIIEAKEQEDCLHIYIQDNGPGFPTALLENGIQAFASGRNDGTGLGLAIVRRFCQEQGGTLTLTNPPGGGACIELTLPRSV
ncbi:MAG: hypothetical protein GXP16_03360 [Gammaproteobacteria bacterium]|nr:hypothetical protein [Gammaproteobacteria bacterium]